MKGEMGLVSKDPEVGKRSLPLGNGVSGADVPGETSAVGALPLVLVVSTRSTAQAAQTKRIGARVKKKSTKVVAAAGGRPSREQHEDELFVLMEEDEVFTDYDFQHVCGVVFDDEEWLLNSWRQ